MCTAYPALVPRMLRPFPHASSFNIISHQACAPEPLMQCWALRKTLSVPPGVLLRSTKDAATHFINRGVLNVMLGFAKGSVGSAWSPPWKYKRCHYYVFHQPGGGSAVGGERVEICVPSYCGGGGFRVGISCPCGDFLSHPFKNLSPSPEHST